MTDRVSSITLVLEEDMREDDAEELSKALMCFKGVVGVGRNVASISEFVIDARIRRELGLRLWEVLHPKT